MAVGVVTTWTVLLCSTAPAVANCHDALAMFNAQLTVALTLPFAFKNLPPTVDPAGMAATGYA